MERQKNLNINEYIFFIIVGLLALTYFAMPDRYIRFKQATEWINYAKGLLGK